MTLKIEATARGFARADFTDRYGEECSIQDSSLATEACIWLGVQDPKPVKMVFGEGWKEVPLPEGAEVFGRMHLTQQLVKDLMPLLERFVKTGSISE